MVTIHITGVHYTVSDKAREHIAEKFGTLDRLHPRLTSLHVTIHEADKFGFRVDVDLHLPSGKDVVAHDTEENLFSAIDVAAWIAKKPMIPKVTTASAPISHFAQVDDADFRFRAACPRVRGRAFVLALAKEPSDPENRANFIATDRPGVVCDLDRNAIVFPGDVPATFFPRTGVSEGS